MWISVYKSQYFLFFKEVINANTRENSFYKKVVNKLNVNKS